MKELLNAPPVAPVFTRCATGETTEHTNTSCAPYVIRAQRVLCVRDRNGCDAGGVQRVIAVAPSHTEQRVTTMTMPGLPRRCRVFVHPRAGGGGPTAGGHPSGWRVLPRS